ncbi:MAG: metalloregulator ArsR/SmtB family transcription factor [Actinomycetota bacterium]
MKRPISEVKAEFFKTLSHPARIRVLELLRDGKLSVGELIPKVGLEPSHLSQQLSALRRANIVDSRKKGSTVYYSITDHRIFELLEVAKQIITGSLTEARELLEEMESPEYVEATPSDT